MSGTSASLSAGATQIDRPVRSETDQLVEDVLTGIAKKVLWPTNTAASLAAEIGCSPRTVERYMEGSRDWSDDALAAILSEILKRRKMRNVRVTARR